MVQRWALNLALFLCIPTGSLTKSHGRGDRDVCGDMCVCIKVYIYIHMHTYMFLNKSTNLGVRVYGFGTAVVASVAIFG